MAQTAKYCDMRQSNKPVKNGMRKSIYLLIFILFISLTCVGVSALKVEGIHGIISNDEGNPVPGATVALYASNGEFIDYTLSMDDGSFCFHVEDGEYFIVVTSEGYLHKRSELFRFDGENATMIDFNLRSGSESIPEKLKSFWPLISLFTFALGLLLEIHLENRRRRREDEIRDEERKDAIKSTIFIPLSVSLSAVCGHFEDIKNILKNITNNDNLNTKMDKIIERLKRDIEELTAILQRILLENKLISYLQVDVREEFSKIRYDVRQFSEWLDEKDKGVIRQSFKDWSKGQESKEISKIIISLESLSNRLRTEPKLNK